MTPDLVALGTLPTLGVVPKQMHAWVVRKDRHGHPESAFRQEVVPVPTPRAGEVLVAPMAAGVNYNGCWAALGRPISVLDAHRHPFHIAGSDAAGIVWSVGPGVTRWKVGDQVVLHCNQSCGECPACNGGDPMLCDDQRIWGYETPYGSFAQFTLVQSRQLLSKPPGMTWEAAASYGLDLFTAYRMLIDRAKLRAGETVLVWGGGGGLGSFACQIARYVHARAVAVVSNERKASLALEHGAIGVIDRTRFPDLPFRPPESDERKRARMAASKAFRQAFCEAAGTERGPDVVLEHPGRETFSTSVFVANRGGRIVICGSTSGFDLTFDVRHLWMRQKQILGSHFANPEECSRANQLVLDGLVTPCVTEVHPWNDIPKAHVTMLENRHVGKMACLINAQKTGQRTWEAS